MQLHAFLTPALDGDCCVTPWARIGNPVGPIGRAGCCRAGGALGNCDVTHWITQTRV